MSQINLDLYEKVIVFNCLKTGNEEYLSSVIDHLDSELFNNRDAATVVQLIKDFYTEHNKIPNRTEIRSKIVNNTLASSFKKMLEEFKLLDSDYTQGELVKNTETFIKQRALLKSIEKSLEEYTTSKEIDEIRALKDFDKIQSISLIDNLGMDFIGDTDKFVAKLSEKESYISTGYTYLDREFNGGLYKEGKAMYAFAGETNVGKAQPTSLEILTPSGVKKFGDIKVGDFVFGKSGNPIKVTHIHPQGIKKVFKVRFMDGRETLCCGDHLWTVWNSLKSKYITISTNEIKHRIETFSTYKNRLMVPLTDPVSFGKDIDHFIDPYVMGCLLGDGGLSVRNSYKFTNFDDECYNKFLENLPDNISLSGMNKFSISRTDRANFTKNEFNYEIKRLGLSETKSNTKFIPEEYLYSSVESRLKLLNGLIDTDGYITKTSSVEITLYNKSLISQIAFLVRSLGGNAKESEVYKKYKGEYKTYYRLRIRFPFSIREKLDIISRKSSRLSKFGENKKSQIHNTILSAEEIGVDECMCITVDSDDHLYLTNDFIVTHNSIVLGNVASNVFLQNYNVAIISLEMSEFRYAKRIASMLSQIPQIDLASKKDDYVQFINTTSKTNNGSLFIKEFPTKQVSAKHVAGYLKKLERKRNFKPDVIILDYHTLLKPSIPQGSKHADMQFITQESRALTYIFDCPLVSAAQLNRSDGNVTGPDLNRIAGSWDMLSDLDYLVNIWQTDEDREAELIRWEIKKGRDSEKNVKHFWNIDYSTLRLKDEDSESNSLVYSQEDVMSGIVDSLGI